AAHQNRSRSGMAEALTKTRNNLRRWRRRHIELQVARHCDLRFGRTNFDEPLPVFAGLGQENIDVPERLSEKSRKPEAEPFVPGKRAVGNAAIDYRDASAAARGKPEKIRPEFSFGDDHEFRTQSIEVRPDRES